MDSKGYGVINVYNDIMNKYIYSKRFLSGMLKDGKEKSDRNLEYFGVDWREIDDLGPSSIICVFCWEKCLWPLFLWRWVFDECREGVGEGRERCKEGMECEELGDERHGWKFDHVGYRKKGKGE